MNIAPTHLYVALFATSHIFTTGKHKNRKENDPKAFTSHAAAPFLSPLPILSCREEQSLTHARRARARTRGISPLLPGHKTRAHATRAHNAAPGVKIRRDGGSFYRRRRTLKRYERSHRRNAPAKIRDNHAFCTRTAGKAAQQPPHVRRICAYTSVMAYRAAAALVSTAPDLSLSVFSIGFRQGVSMLWRNARLLLLCRAWHLYAAPINAARIQIWLEDVGFGYNVPFANIQRGGRRIISWTERTRMATRRQRARLRLSPLLRVPALSSLLTILPHRGT